MTPARGQLDLEGNETTELTHRQSMALAFVRTSQPVDADEVGAVLHSAREKHSADLRCDWCGIDGRQVLLELRRKGLVRQRRGEGWVLASESGEETARGAASTVDPATSEIPY